MTFNLDCNPKILFLYPGQSRESRISGLADGSIPQDFFYGLLGARQAGYSCSIGDTRKDPQGIVSNLHLSYEILRNRYSKFGYSYERLKAVTAEIQDADIALSFTDFFSLSMGLWAANNSKKTILVGGFHGLTDQVKKAHPLWRRKYETMIRSSLQNLDHMFFFGESDRKEAIKNYSLNYKKTSLFPFGVDTKFWKPSDSVISNYQEEYILAVGSDPQRDFDSLVLSPTNVQIKILSKLNIQVPRDRKNIQLLRGSFYDSVVTDGQLRQLYQSSLAVVVPLKDVNQPSGYSVTLQAMACGKPVILTKTCGLWDPHLFKSGENCILVDAYNPRQIAQAILRLNDDKDLRSYIGNKARETACAHFGIERMNAGIVELIKTSWSRR